MFDVVAYLIALIPALLLAAATWAISLKRHDASLVDRIWGIFFALVLAAYVLQLHTLSDRGWLVGLLVFVWAARLSIYISVRNWGHGEDRRYREIRNRNQPGFAFKSLYLVFAFQALLAWVIAIPLMVAVSDPSRISWLDYAGVLVWSLGMAFEVIGDWQLARFKSDSDNQGKVLNRGLWRYTRHPNYFGECTIWWGYYLFACAAGGWWTVYAPLIMTLFLLRVSGVSLLEKDISERRPAYRDYIRNTSAFIPWPPKDGTTEPKEDSP